VTSQCRAADGTLVAARCNYENAGAGRKIQSLDERALAGWRGIGHPQRQIDQSRSRLHAFFDCGG